MITRCTRLRVPARPLVEPTIILRRLASDSARTRAPSSSTSHRSNSNNNNNKKAFVAATAAMTVAASAGIYVSHSSDARGFISRQFTPALIRADARPTEQSSVPSKYAQLSGGQVEFPRAAGFATKSTRMLSEEEVAEKLSEHEESYLVDRGHGVARFDITQLASNCQIEDDFTAKIVNVNFADGPSDWYFFGVFDGHGGWNTSAKLRELLVPYVAAELMDKMQPDSVPKTFGTESAANARLIDEAIEMAFLKLDDDMVRKPLNFLIEHPYKPASPELLMPAMSGSCALLSLYDSATGTLRVACTGDSRAVWGHKDASGSWTATPLSYDQCGRNQTEITRLQKEHPGEPDVIKNGRVLGGLEPTRAFGDARYKLPSKVLDKATSLFFGRSSPSNSASPPYVTAKPEILTTKVSPGDFLVLATDGIWDELSCREVVQLVVEWVRKREIDSGTPPPGIVTHVRKGGIFSSVSDLADVKVKSDTAELNARLDQRAHGDDLAQIQLRNAIAMQKHFRGLFTVEDNNAATHIVRNALGGADKEQTSMLVSIPPPISRRYRDDMTVLVVFFGEPKDAEKSGKITQIQEATKGGKV